MSFQFRPISAMLQVIGEVREHEPVMGHIERQDNRIREAHGQLSPHPGGDLVEFQVWVDQARHPPVVVVQRVVQWRVCIGFLEGGKAHAHYSAQRHEDESTARGPVQLRRSKSDASSVTHSSSTPLFIQSFTQPPTYSLAHSQTLAPHSFALLLTLSPTLSSNESITQSLCPLAY